MPKKTDKPFSNAKITLFEEVTYNFLTTLVNGFLLALLGLLCFPFKWTLLLLLVPFITVAFWILVFKKKQRRKWRLVGYAFIFLTIFTILYSPLIMSRNYTYIYFSSGVDFWNNRVIHIQDLPISVVYVSDPVRRWCLRKMNPFPWKYATEIQQKTVGKKKFLEIPVRYALDYVVEPSKKGQFVKNKYSIPLNATPISISITSDSTEINEFSDFHYELSAIFGTADILTHYYYPEVDKILWPYVHLTDELEDVDLEYVACVAYGLEQATLGNLGATKASLFMALDLAPGVIERTRPLALLANMFSIMYGGNLGQLEALFYWNRIYDYLGAISKMDLILNPHLHNTLDDLENFYGRFGFLFKERLEEINEKISDPVVTGEKGEQSFNEIKKIFFELNNFEKFSPTEQAKIMEDFFDYSFDQFSSTEENIYRYERFLSFSSEELSSHIKKLEQVEANFFIRGFINFLMQEFAKYFFLDFKELLRREEADSYFTAFSKKKEAIERIVPILIKTTNDLDEPFKSQYIDILNKFTGFSWLWDAFVLAVNNQEKAEEGQFDQLFIDNSISTFAIVGIDTFLIKNIYQEDKQDPDDALKERIGDNYKNIADNKNHMNWVLAQLYGLLLIQEGFLYPNDLALLKPENRDGYDFIPATALQLIAYRFFKPDSIPENSLAIERYLDAPIKDLIEGPQEKKIRLCEVCVEIVNQEYQTEDYYQGMLKYAEEWIQRNRYQCVDIPDRFNFEGYAFAVFTKRSTPFLKSVDIAPHLVDEVMNIKPYETTSYFVENNKLCFGRLIESIGWYVPD